MRKAKKRPTYSLARMATPILFLLLVFASISCGSAESDRAASNGQSKQTTGKDKADEIIAEFLKRDAAPYRKVRVRFTITSESDSTKIYELDTWRRQSENQITTLTQIVKPAEDSDLASLTVETAGQPTVVTTYSATLKDFRDTDTNKMFFGGITAGELLGEWGKFDYKMLKEETRDGHPFYQIEGKLKKDQNGVINRIEIDMDGSDYVPRELRVFDASGRQIRTFTIRDVKTDPKGAYAASMEADNSVYKTKMLIEVLGREFPDHLDDTMFTKDRLKAIATKQKPA
jgi:outer membrane lipoprotein-sorting protein